MSNNIRMNKENKKDDGIKKLWGISKKALYIIIGIVIVILLLIFLVLFRINFLVGEQLRITLTPEYSEAKTASPGSVPFEINMRLYNKFVCDAECTYTFSDASHNIILDNGTFHSKVYKSKSYSFDIPIEYYGYGTNIYLYRLECKNIKTALCPAGDDLLVRKSLLTVTYSPSDEQLSALNFSRENYALISENIVNASKFIAVEEGITDSIAASNISFDSSTYYALKSERDALNVAVNSLMSVWKNNDYLSIKAFITDTSLVGRSAALLSNVVQYNAYITATINDYNLLLSELNSVHSTLEEYRTVLLYDISSMNQSTRASMINAIRDGNSFITTFNSLDYNNIMLYDDVMKLKNIMTNLSEIVVNDTQSELSTSNPSIYVYSHILCMMNVTLNASNNVNTNVSTNLATNLSTNVSTYIYNNIDTKNFCDYNYALNVDNLSEAQIKLANVCNRASDILDNVAALNNLNNIGSSGNDSVDSMDTLLLQYKLLIDYGSEYDTSGKSAVWNPYTNYLRNTLKDSYNINNPEALLSGYVFNESSITLNTNNLLLSDIRNIRASCYDSNTTSIPALTPITAKYYPVPLFDTFDALNITDVYAVAPPEAVPQCCMYGKCQSCEKTPKKNLMKNPLILLHGHSFNKDTNAYLSIEIFDGFESKLDDDRLYFPTGMLVKDENSTSGILGHYYVPLVSKPTYYLETYNDLLGLTVSESKTGNIDTYALRLKEYIDYTMYITGSTKVDIVAHSMGGLVVRRYMQIFGTQNLGTVILIASPNNGIGDRTYNLCKIFGASNECDDMRTDSIFIKKLNDFSTQPDIKSLYLIVGRGCNTDGVDGDGVVSVNNSLMSIVSDSHVLYINGTCSGTTLLHNELLNIDKYPEVYEFVKEKLG